MATYNPDRFYGNALTAVTTTVLATVPASTKWIVKHIVLCNTTAADIYVTIKLGPARVAAGLLVPAANTVEIPLSQVVLTTETITGGATAVGVDAMISGVVVA